MTDVQGIQSASRQSFVLQTYQALIPTIYDRYVVTNCYPSKNARYCSGPTPGAGVIGNRNSFTTLGLPTTTSFDIPNTPCI